MPNLDHSSLFLKRQWHGRSNLTEEMNIKLQCLHARLETFVIEKG